MALVRSYDSASSVSCTHTVHFALVLFCFTQLLVVCEENSEGGGLLEYQMQQSEIPLRFFECAIEVQETKKEVQARGLVTLKFVPGPGEDSKNLTRIIEESFREQLHALEESFLS